MSDLPPPPSSSSSSRAPETSPPESDTVPQLPPSPPAVPSSDPPASSKPKRLPGVDDFPETGTNALASFSQRAWARVIDELITDLPFVIVMSLLLATTLTSDGEATSATESMASDVPLWLLVGAVALAITYEIVAVAWKGQTIGKWAMGIRVARYTDGKKPHLAQSALRCLLPATAGVATLWFAGVTALGAFVVLASAYANPLRRGWHDDAGGTVVVRTR